MCSRTYVRGGNPIGPTWRLSRGERRKESSSRIYHANMCQGLKARTFSPRYLKSVLRRRRRRGGIYEIYEIIDRERIARKIRPSLPVYHPNFVLEVRSNYLSLMKHMHINNRCLASSASEFRDRLGVQIARG